MVKIILMRHAESSFNYAIEALENKYQSDDPELKKQLMALKVSQDPDILNAKLTPKGISQCKKSSQGLAEKFPNIKRVLLSPLRRPCQTFETTFEDYPRFKSGQLKISFCDTLREVIYSSCDIAMLTEHERKD